MGLEPGFNASLCFFLLAELQHKQKYQFEDLFRDGNA